MITLLAIAICLLVTGACYLIMHVNQLLATKYTLTSSERRQAASTRICIIGCGVSGICAGHFLRLMGVNITIIEKGSRPGGTWFWNRYPGAGCDVDSHLYSFSWFLNPNWSLSFSLQDEIEDYLMAAWRYARLEQHTMFNSTVTRAKWTDGSKWLIDYTTSDGEQVTTSYDFVISCVGALHKPMIPQFKGLTKFNGDSWHTAEWRDDVELEGKRVAMIGTGASAVQILPTLTSKCRQVYLFQRTAHYCLPRFESRFSSWFKWLMRFQPFALVFRWTLYWSFDSLWFLVFGPLKPLKSLYTWYYERYLSTVKNASTRSQLRATFDLGCKRILFSNTFYKQLNEPNVHLDGSKLIEITPNGLRTEDGEYADVDIIIYATGFQLKENFSFIYDHNPQMKQYADENNNAAYYGLMHPFAPNFATFLGPMTGLGHSSIIFMIECQMQLLINILREKWRRGAQVVHVKQAATDRLLNEWNEKVDASVWRPGNCTSFYQRGSKDSRPWLLWPTTTTEFWYRTKDLCVDDFLFE